MNRQQFLPGRISVHDAGDQESSGNKVDTALRHRVNAGRVALRNQIGFFDKLMGAVTSEWKADDTRVTFADFAISEKILTELRGSFKNDNFLSEESLPLDETFQIDAKYAWILDPIDGTNNFALGMPSCAISLALLKDGMPVYGLIYDGATRELLEGGQGAGILVNGRKYDPPERYSGSNTAMVALHFPLPEGRALQLKPILESCRIRSLGSATLHLAYLALGRLDGVIDEKVRLWDIAAAICLLSGNDCSIRYFDDSPFPVRTIDMSGPHIRYIAGTKAFLSKVEKCLG
jgi:myo-inositol-1(or 4)-monophosphatase